ncbi:hypothetical protein OAT67_03315 [Bacteriovoracaceae bacterium]|nr:hypothetical protein [Bacteriovoracaceae bacterium]
MKLLNKKKTFIILVSSLFAITSCDAPRDRRVASQNGSTSNQSIFGDSSSSYYDSGDGSSSSSGSGSGSGSGSSSAVTIPSQINHCQWATDGETGFASSHKHLSPDEDSSSNGNYTVCKSTADEKDIYLQVKHPIDDAQVCIFPTYHSGSNSVYIGEPRCLLVDDNKKIYKVSVLKNRAGFTQYPVTGVMIMKDKAYFYDRPYYQEILSPDAYVFCSNWMAQFNDPSYCVEFKNKGHFVYKQF